MKKLMMIALLASVAWAADFSHMSTDEMMNMRGSVPVDDRPAFREEMQKRMQSMTPQERQQYKSTRQGMMGMGQGKGMGRNSMNQPTFAQYDLNNDGGITQKELEEARAKRMKQNAAEGKMLRNAENAPEYATMDINNDGIIDQNEFRYHQTAQMKMKNKGNCVGNCPGKGMGKGTGVGRNARNIPTFADIDTNNDGTISKEEFRVHQSQRMKNQGNCAAGNCP
ncbi:MAG: DUF1104 domain-containing protein [Sulfurovum sp.]|uniref:DUF1104 domain-containing protein n=1 Tax=Sulfurovum sp. TaxID=1969726 RepID=UPI00286834DB|nr:DUF1104 domain-containing protein [Sulfurovum sp.]MCO4845427.1 DUF1104 domain-containing protein [Sulfurovum sp.]